MNTILHIIFACFFMLCSCNLSFAKHGVVKDAISGNFDYYVFAQAWYPIFCEGGPENECNKLTEYMKTNISPHGLWPNFNNTGNKLSYPAACIKSPGCTAIDACSLNVENISQET